MTEKKVYLVSACLVGLCTRYDGCVRSSSTCLADLQGNLWVPVCPEQLGGLPTPRIAADLVGGDGMAVLDGGARVIDRQGTDVTCHFIRGAEQCLLVARMLGIKSALLRAKSPSCGLNPQLGVTAALLSRHGIEVVEYR